MNVIFDASSLLNLANGGVLDTVLAIPNLHARVGSIVLDECASIAQQLRTIAAAGRLTLVDDDSMPATSFITILDRYELGEGETECVVLAAQGDDVVCCDDRRARNMIAEELGRDRVTGTLGLLARATFFELLTKDAALGAYEQMRRRGGFLPELSAHDFDLALKKQSAS